MSWTDELKKEKFQGPERKHAKFQADEMQLGMTIRAIHSFLKNAIEHLEKATSDNSDGIRQSFWLRQTKSALNLAMEEIDSIDEEMLERAKYVGRKKETYQFGDRLDHDELDYEGGKYPRNRDDGE